jgi:hypothetical protein
MAHVGSRGSALTVLAAPTTTAAALGGLVAMFIIGRHQRSILLIVLFTLWVLSPLVALVLINARAKSWAPAACTTIQYATLLISLGALARYAWVVMWPLKAQPASTFLIVPLVSWIAIGVAAAVARRR